MEPYDLPELKTPEEIWAYLALKQANGLSLDQVLDIHTVVLSRIARDYVKTWGPEVEEVDADVHQMYEYLKDGACYALSYLENDDEWYDFDRDLTWE